MDLLATEPIVDDDDLIAAALSRLSVSALTASVVQITGDPAYVRGPIRPRQFVQNEFQGSLDADEQDQLRRDALKAICAWRCSFTRATEISIRSSALMTECLAPINAANLRAAHVRLESGKTIGKVVLAGGVAGPVLLMIGLTRMPASSAALLLNLEGLATMAIAGSASSSSRSQAAGDGRARSPVRCR